MTVAEGDLEAAGVVRNFVEAWPYMSSQYPGNVQTHEGPVAVALSRTNCSFLNIMTFDQPLVDLGALRDAIGIARRHAAACPHATMLLVCPEWMPEGSDAILANEKLAFSMPMWGMATDALRPLRRDPPRLDFQLITDNATGLDLGRINAEAYGMSPAFFTVTGDIFRWSGQHFGVVGYDGGRAVTASLAYVLDDRIYVAWVATLPGLHGMGYAEAGMRHAITAAQEVAGRRRLWLHASEMGRPLYRSMGFADGARVDLYAFA